MLRSFFGVFGGLVGVSPHSLSDVPQDHPKSGPTWRQLGPNLAKLGALAQLGPNLDQLGPNLALKINKKSIFSGNAENIFFDVRQCKNQKFKVPRHQKP